MDVKYGTAPGDGGLAPPRLVQASFLDGGKWASAVNAPRFVEVFSGLFTSSIVYRQIQVDLFKRLAALSIPEAYHMEPSHVLGVQSFLSDPAGVPPVAAFTRAAEKLAEAPAPHASVQAARSAYLTSGRYDQRGQNVVHRVYELALGYAQWSNVPVKRFSTTAAPHFTTDFGVKMKVIDMWADRARLFGQLFHAEQFDKLAEYGIVYLYANGYRSQVTDSATVDAQGRATTKKKRVYFTWDNEWVETDRTYSAPKFVKTIDATLDQHVLATRSRQVSMSPYAASIPARIAARAMEQGMYTGRCSAVYHHHGIAAVRDAVRGAVSYAVYDVGNHDQNIGFDPIEALVARAIATVGPAIAELFKLLHQCPSVVRNDYRYGKGVRLRGDPLKPWDAEFQYGNPSGSPTTSIVAKVTGHFYYVDAMMRYCASKGYHVDLDAVITNSDPRFKCLNLGDNLLFVAFDRRFTEFGTDMAMWQPFAILEGSDTFMGNTVIGDGSGEPRFEPNLMSFVTKTVNPDRTLTSPHRGNTRVAYDARLEVYGENQHFEPVFNAVDGSFTTVTGLTLKEWAYRSPEPEVIPGIDYNDLSIAEKEYINDYSVVEWKHNPALIRPGLLETVYYSMPASKARTIVDEFQRGYNAK